MSMKKIETGNSCVLSVKLYPGCYKHIQVDSNETFEELADQILRAFDFDNDHCYAFFLSGKAWDRNSLTLLSANACESSSEHHVADYLLSDYLPEKGKSILFLYDFGDKWRFSIRLLKKIDGPTYGCKMLLDKGDNPEQYPAYDEDL